MIPVHHSVPALQRHHPAHFYSQPGAVRLKSCDGKICVDEATLRGCYKVPRTLEGFIFGDKKGLFLMKINNEDRSEAASYLNPVKEQPFID